MMVRSTSARLVVLYCALLALLGAGFLAFTVLRFRHYTREIIASNLAIRAEGIWSVSRKILDQPDRLADAIEFGFSPEVQSRFIRLRRADAVLYQSGMPADRRFDPSAMTVAEPVPGDGARLFGDLLLISRQYRDPHGRTVIVDVGQSFYFVQILQRELATSLLVGLPVLLALAGLAGYVLMRRTQAPVEAMVKAAETYSFNQPHMRLPLVRNEPRLEALGLALNRLLDRLDNAYSHASRFSADAAHELRTPLTIVRGELELLATGENLPSDAQAAVVNALEEITRLSGIVDSLIMLSRMESIWGKKSHSPVNLNKLAEEILLQIHLLGVEKGIQLVGPVGSPAVVAGDRDRLKQVLVNLLDNAIKYTPTGGTVTVRIGAEGDKGFVSVSDTGIGISELHQERVFDRFYRVSPDRGEAGAGLGLAIVKSICTAHGGTVILSSEPASGSCFRVEIPLMRETDERSFVPDADPLARPVVHQPSV